MLSVAGPDAFYERDGELLLATELTRGPWDPGAQHAGPPAALLGRAIEGLEDAAEFHVGRLSFDILRSVPIAPLRASARVLRPGRRVQLVEAELSDGEGEVLMRATAWRLRTAPTEVPAELAAPDPPPPGPAEGAETDFFPTGQELGYHSAMEVRFAAGGWLEPGPAQAWMRMRGELVEGEPVEPRDRVLIASDSGNGVSAPLDYERFVFINCDLNVNLRRLPDGDWVALDATTYADATGIGMSDSVLHDRHGMIGRATQALLISERG